MYCLCVNVYCHRVSTKCVLPPGVNPTTVDKYINIFGEVFGISQVRILNRFLNFKSEIEWQISLNFRQFQMSSSTPTFAWYDRVKSLKSTFKAFGGTRKLLNIEDLRY
jgi:hypothetical protein